MNRSLGSAIAVLVFACPLLLLGQPQEAAPQRPSVQVGVPEGRSDRGGAANAPRGRPTGPPKPVPRGANGHVLLGGSTPTEKGVWLPGPVIPNPLAIKDIPFQPWAKALFADRKHNELEPHTRCKPSGVSRQFLTPYGVELVELSEAQRVFVFDIGGPHTFREVFMDGRSHPKDFTPTYYGHSIGWWEGDTLVVDSVGFNERFWIDRGQLPHTDKLHLIEKYTRTSLETMRYELTVDDPAAYTATFTGVSNLRWQADTELFEYICQQANQAHTLMVGDATSVDRTSPIVP